MVYFMEHPTKNWMMTGGSPCLGNLQKYFMGWWDSMDVWNPCMESLVTHWICSTGCWFQNSIETHPGIRSRLDFSLVHVSFCEDLSATLAVVFDECPVHNMATWIHLLTKLQQMKLMRWSLSFCAWPEKEWNWSSIAPCLGLTCAGWCQRSFHGSQAQSSPCIMWMEVWRWIKTCESKGLLENLQRCPALTYQLMCIQHGVMSVISQIVSESLRWKVLHILKEHLRENIISPAALEVSLLTTISDKAWSGWPCHQVFTCWLLATVSTKAWSGWPCHQVLNFWVLATVSTKAWSGWPCHQVLNFCFLAMSSTKAWSGWPCHRVFKAWVWAASSTKAWRGWPCHQVFKAWVLETVSTKAWSGSPCHQVFKAWVLTTVSTKAWSGWPCHRGFKAWVLATVSTKAWSGWPCHRVFKAWVLDRISTKACCRWACHRVFKAWVCAASSTKAWSGSPCQALKTWWQGHPLQALVEHVAKTHQVFKAWVLATVSTKAWSGWPCHRGFKAWVLATVSTKAWSGWPCHRVFKAWVWAATKAWSGWPCHQVFTAWVLATISTKAWSGSPCHQVFKACVLATCSTKAWRGWPCHQVFKAWVLATVSTKAWSGWPCHRVFKGLVLSVVAIHHVWSVWVPQFFLSFVSQVPWYRSKSGLLCSRMGVLVNPGPGVPITLFLLLFDGNQAAKYETISGLAIHYGPESISKPSLKNASQDFNIHRKN